MSKEGDVRRRKKAIPVVNLKVVVTKRGRNNSRVPPVGLVVFR